MRIFLQITMMVSLGAMAFVGVAGQTAPPPAPESAPAPTDEDQLRTLIADLETAWAQQDAAAAAALFAEDGDSLTSAGHAQGRSAVEEMYRQNFEGIFKGTTIAAEMTSVRFLEPDVAVSDGTYEITGLKGPDGEDLPPTKGLWTGVNVKTADGWRIGCSRPMIPLPMSDAS